MASGTKGKVVKQAIGHLSGELGPGDPREIAWVQSQLTGFKKYLEKEWANGPDLDQVFSVGLRDVNRDAREKARARRADPDYKAAYNLARQQRRSTPEQKAREIEYSRRSNAKKKATRGKGKEE